MLEKFDGGGRWRIAPEYLPLVTLVLDAEDREQGIGIDNRIDFQQQFLDEFAPIAHHVGSDDEFFQQLDFEFEDVLVDRDVFQPIDQQVDVLEYFIEFLEAQIGLADVELVQILDRADRLDLFPEQIH